MTLVFDFDFDVCSAVSVVSPLPKETFYFLILKFPFEELCDQYQFWDV